MLILGVRASDIAQGESEPVKKEGIRIIQWLIF